VSAEDVAVAEKRWGRTGVLNKGGVAEVQLLEGTVSRRLVASGYPPKMLP
jgi:hypothetical protein